MNGIFRLSVRLSVRPFLRNTTPVASFRYSWWLCGYFGLCGWPHKTISNDFMKCLYMPYVFNFLGKKQTHTLWTLVCVQVSMYGLKQKNTQVMIICVQVPMYGLSFLQNTTSVAIFWYSWYFCGYFVYLQPHKTDSHTGKKTPKFMDKSSHKTPFCGSGHTDAATQNPIATQEKGTQIYGQK